MDFGGKFSSTKPSLLGAIGLITPDLSGSFISVSSNSPGPRSAATGVTGKPHPCVKTAPAESAGQEHTQWSERSGVRRGTRWELLRGGGL